MASIISPFDIPTPRSQSPQGQVMRHRFTLHQYHEMIERGIFAEDEPVELIRGEIVRKMPIGNPHAAAVNVLNRILSKWVPEDAMISIQNPVSIDDSEPEPDVAILNSCEDSYASRRPTASDVRLLIEVADSSLAYDRDVKGPIYAAAGIADYWIVNLNNATVEIHRDPQPDGRFATVLTARAGATIAPLAAPSLSIQLNDLF